MCQYASVCINVVHICENAMMCDMHSGSLETSLEVSDIDKYSAILTIKMACAP